MPGTRITEFDTWRGGYGLASVRVVLAGTDTLATIYSDEDLTAVADNPITLAERVVDGVSYGRFSAPHYVGVSYELIINSVDRTGISRPALTTLVAADASKATVRAAGGSKDVELEDHLIREIDVRDQGDFIAVSGAGASATTNNNTLVTAIGVAASRAGGFVRLPEGTFTITNFTIPQGVVLRGSGRNATILQSTQATTVVTIGGNRAGFSRMTLDGVSLVAGSVGVLALNKDHIVFDDAEIKRFETGLYRKGGTLSNWRELYINNCVDGYKGHGDLASGLGAAAQFNYWNGGKVESCSGIGVETKYVDALCHHQIFRGLSLNGNTGTAAKVVGARDTSFHDCWWDNNTKSLVVQDGSPLTTANTVIGLEVVGGQIKDGTIELSGNLEAVTFRRTTLQSVAVTLTTPSNNVIAEDCREVSGVTFAGTATAWLRRKRTDRGASGGVTTGNSATKTWAIALDHGERVYLEGKVIGRQRNGINDGYYHIAVSARRPGASLAYDTQTVNFTVGDVLTGATSGATARITADSDGGTTGTLTLQDVVGTFVDNEIITGSSGGSAMANGAISTSNAELAGSVTELRAAQETDATWAATFVANGPEIELRVTGATSQTIEWTADVEAKSL